MALILKYYRKSEDKQGYNIWIDRELLNTEVFAVLQSALKNKEVSFISKENNKDEILCIDFHLKNGDYITIF